MSSDVLATGSRHRYVAMAAGITATSVNVTQVVSERGCVKSPTASGMLTHTADAVRFM